METIPFLVSLPDEDEQVKGLFSTETDIALRDLPTDLLRKGIGSLLASMAGFDQGFSTRCLAR
ncbi:MAG: hypothetical protein ACFBSF_06195 [Leptolyngbyaceae cyanobacterium]